MENPEEMFDEPDELEITEAQWELVKNEWNSRPKNPPSIMELTQLVFNKPGLDGRSAQGRAIRKKLAESNLKAPTTKYQGKGLIVLDESQKEYVGNNLSTMKSVEMARILFNNNSLTNLSQETRSVADYVKTLNPEEPIEDVDDIPKSSYSPPRSLEGALKKVNKYKYVPLEKDKLTGKQKKDISSLLAYLNTYRFIRQINVYGKNEDRELFEDTFIRYTYDKYDLTEEEVDQYILLSAEIITAAEIQSRKEMLNNLLTNSAEAEDPKISMSLVESIETANTEYDKCITRQTKLLDSLKVKRSEKESKGKDSSASIINLVQMWKDEDSRVKMLKFAEKKKENLKKGAEELMSMDELKARMAGIDMDLILGG